MVGNMFHFLGNSLKVIINEYRQMRFKWMKGTCTKARYIFSWPT